MEGTVVDRDKIVFFLSSLLVTSSSEPCKHIAIDDLSFGIDDMTVDEGEDNFHL